MSRYLDPSKISYIALLQLYLEDFVPVDSSVPVLSFIVSSLLPPKSSLSTTPHEFEAFSSSTIEKFCNKLSIYASSIPGRTLWDLLLEKLWNIGSLDALHRFFYFLASRMRHSRVQLLRDSNSVTSSSDGWVLLSRRSPVGIFVRKSILEFNRLQLQNTLKLWEAFILFRGPTTAMWSKRNPSFKLGNLDLVAGDPTASPNSCFKGKQRLETRDLEKSVSDIESILEFQIDRIQKLGLRLPMSMKPTLEEVISRRIVTPNLSHYVKFLESWKAGDYPSTFDNLHRYFDYTMQSSDRTFYQYALLNLAIIHADFGCFREAMSAMQETIATARENKDIECLHYSLTWLLTLGSTRPADLLGDQRRGPFGSERETLIFLKSKAKELHISSLLSACLLSEARLILSYGNSVTPALDNVIQASHLNALRGISNSVSSQMAMQGSIFSRLGFSCLAWSLGHLFLECYAMQAPAADVLLCYITFAHQQIQRGHWKEPLADLKDFDQEKLRTLKYQQNWITHTALINLRVSLQRDDLSTAGHCLDQLRAVPAPDEAFAFALELRALETQLLQANIEDRRLGIETAISRLEDRKANVIQRAMLATFKARFYLQFHMPHRALSIAVRVANFAYKIHLVPLLWEAIAIVAHVLLSLSEFEASAGLLECIIPQTLECEDHDLTGACMACVADAYMGIASRPIAGAAWKMKEKMIRALGLLENAESEFAKVGNVKRQREMLAKKGTILMKSDDQALANDCAAKYLEIGKELDGEAQLR